MDIIYRAADGTEFNIEDECKLYEKNLEEIKSCKSVEACIVLGLSNSKCQAYDEAIKYFKRALELDNQNPDIYSYIGDCKYDLEEYEEAIELFKGAINLDDQDPYPYKSIGYCKHDLEEYEEASKYFRHAIALEDTRSNSKKEIYRASDGTEFNDEDECKLYKKKFEKPQYKKDAEHKIKNGFWWGLAARNFEKSNKLQDSIFCYKQQSENIQKAIDLDDRNPNLYIDMGNNKFDLKEYQEAIDYYEKAIALNHEDPSTCNTLIRKCRDRL